MLTSHAFSVSIFVPMLPVCTNAPLQLTFHLNSQPNNSFLAIISQEWFSCSESIFLENIEGNCKLSELWHSDSECTNWQRHICEKTKQQQQQRNRSRNGVESQSIKKHSIIFNALKVHIHFIRGRNERDKKETIQRFMAAVVVYNDKLGFNLILCSWFSSLYFYFEQIRRKNCNNKILLPPSPRTISPIYRSIERQVFELIRHNTTW